MSLVNICGSVYESRSGLFIYLCDFSTGSLASGSGSGCQDEIVACGLSVITLCPKLAGTKEEFQCVRSITPKTCDGVMISYVEFMSGCFGGMAGVLVGQPFDTVKVRLQTQSGGTMYRGVWHCLASIVKHETPKGLFKGMTSPLLGLSFINAIVFGVQARAIGFLGRETTYTHFVSGAFAGAVQSVVSAPMELAKTQMQVQGIGKKTLSSDAYKSPIDCMKQIYRGYGLRGCYKGMIITLMRDTPAFGFYFAAYDILTSTVLVVDKTETYRLGGVLRMMLAGGLSGITSWVLTYPMDVIKSRFQADSFQNPKYKDPIDCLKKGLQREGIRVLWRGLNSTIVRAFPVNAATFAVVQVSTQHFHKRRSNH